MTYDKSHNALTLTPAEYGLIADVISCLICDNADTTRATEPGKGLDIGMTWIMPSACWALAEVLEKFLDAYQVDGDYMRESLQTLRHAQHRPE